MKRFMLLFVVTALIPVAFAGTYTVGGGGGTGNTIPWWGNNPSYPQMRFQCIWLQTQINEAGTITKVEQQDWNANSTGGTFGGCKVLLCHTSLATITATFADNYGGNTPVTVFDGTKVIPDVNNGDWVTIAEGSNLFQYNNTANLLYEVSWTSPSGGANYFNNSSSGQSGRVYANSATALTGTVTNGYCAVGRITITPGSGVAPSSLGRVRAMFK